MAESGADPVDRCEYLKGAAAGAAAFMPGVENPQQPGAHDHDADRLLALPPLPRDEEGPIFAEPWQAQAFALAVTLSEQGHFTWKEWTSVLADEIKAAPDRREPDDGSGYYHCWLAALERLVTEKGLADPSALLARKEAWADAYRHTRHGKPVELRRG